jgi:hypothetical protein
MSKATTARLAGKPARGSKRPERFVSWAARLACGAGLLRLREAGSAPHHYFVSALSADFGRGFLVEKVGPAGQVVETYHVNVNGQQSLCECKGWLRWQHCKHVESLAALIDHGRL